MGDAGEPGPAYIEIPDRRAAHQGAAAAGARRMDGSEAAARAPARSGARYAEAVEAFWSARRPLVITGRGARQAGAALVRFLDRTRRALPRYAGEPRACAGRPSFDRCRRARRSDGGSGRRAADRPQARLPGRLRIAGRLSQRALHPPRRQCRRAHRQPPRPARIARLAAARTRCDARRSGQPRAAASTRPGPKDSRRRHRERTAPRTRPMPTGRRGRQDPPARHLRCDRRGRRSRTTSRLPTAAIS